MIKKKKKNKKKKKKKNMLKSPNPNKKKKKKKKKKKMGWEGELILQILPRRNSLDERKCSSHSLTVQTSLDTTRIN